MNKMIHLTTILKLTISIWIIPVLILDFVLTAVDDLRMIRGEVKKCE